MGQSFILFQGFLSEDALAAVQELLPDSAEGDFAVICSWADEFRFHYRWSSALHFVDTLDFKCNFDYSSKFALPLMLLSSARVLLEELHMLRSRSYFIYELLLFFFRFFSVMVSGFGIGDCHDSARNKDRCVAGAIFNYTNQLTSYYQNSNSEINCKHCFIIELYTQRY